MNLSPRQTSENPPKPAFDFTSHPGRWRHRRENSPLWLNRPRRSRIWSQIVDSSWFEKVEKWPYSCHVTCFETETETETPTALHCVPYVKLHFSFLFDSIGPILTELRSFESNALFAACIRIWIPFKHGYRRRPRADRKTPNTEKAVSQPIFEIEWSNKDPSTVDKTAQAVPPTVLRQRDARSSN